MPLTADKTYTWNGLKVYEYLLTSHNPYGIAMPGYNLPAVPLGVTVHNTEAISVASNTTPAEQYTRATVNGNMNDVRVHFYVDDYCAWQTLPLTLSGWHAADGGGNGNRKTIAIEVIGNSTKAEANCAKLVAYLLNKYNLNVENNLFTHTHWLNVRDGITGSNDYLNTRKHPYKWCPIYILPHWAQFKANCIEELNKLRGAAAPQNSTSVTTSTEMYRIRKDWIDVKSQIGAYTSLDNAKKAWKEGYKIFNSKGESVYPTDSVPVIEKPVEKPADEPIELPEKPIDNSSTEEKIDVIYRVRTTSWLNEITNCNDTSDMGYAGRENTPIRCLVAKATKGTLRYRVHLLGGGWLGWITKYNISDWYHGYAGLPTQTIDAIQVELTGVEGYEAEYRVSPLKTTATYYPWVRGISDYAGVFGRAIDKIQIRIIKK